MKRFSIVFLVLICVMSCKNDSKSTDSTKTTKEETDTAKDSIVDGYLIDGTIMNANDQEVSLYQIYPNDSLQRIASTVVKKNHFQFTGKVAQPDFYILKLNSDRECKILLENTTLSVFLSKENFKHEISSTAALSHQYELLHERLNAINTTEQPLQNAKKVVIANFIKENIEKSLSILVLKDNLEFLDFEIVQETFEIFPDSLKNNPTGKFIANFIQKKIAEKPVVVTPPKKKVVKKKVEFRPPANAFSGKTQQGTEMSLASISQGKVVLIDFWASWCQPCRVQSPHIVSLYKKYKDRGLVILSVSEDKDEAAWSKAIIDDHFNWNTHIIDNNKSIAFRYGIEAIPHTVLIDKNGKIAAEKLSGRSLEEKIKQLLNE